LNKENSIQNLLPNISAIDILESAPVGILIFDGKGIITTVTSNFFAFGIIAASYHGELNGTSILKKNLFVECGLSSELTELLKGDGFEKVVQSKKVLSGGIVNILLKGAPIFSGDQVQGGILIVEDVRIDAGLGESKLIESADFYGFLSKLSDYFLIIAPDGEMVYKHEAGIPGRLDFISEKFKKDKSNIYSLSNLPIINEMLETVRGNNQSVAKQIPVEYKKEEYHVKLMFVPYVSVKNELQLIITLINDETAKFAEDNQVVHEINELKKYQNISTLFVDAIIGIDLSGKINYWNENATDLFGFTKSEIYGKFIGKVIPVFDKIFLEGIKGELVKNRIWEDQIKLGRDEDVEYIKARLGYIGEGDNKSIIILFSNITERVNREKELKHSEEKFRDIVTNTYEFICTLDLKGNITYANPNFIETFGYSENELADINFRQFINPGFLKTNNFKIDLKSINKPDAVELPLITKDGNEIYTLSSFTLVKDLNGKAKHFNCIITNISGKKDSQKDLLLIRSVFEASQEGIIVICNRKLILANDHFVKMFGYDLIEEVIGKDPLDFVYEKDIPQVAKFIQAREKKTDAPTRYDFTGKKKDESTFFVENSVTTYEMDNEIYIVSMLRDVTETRRAKKLIEDSEARYRNIADNIDECMWTAERVDGKLKVVFYTAAIKKITGYPYKDFINNPKLWFEITHPDDTSDIISKLKRLYRDPARNFDELEYRIINKLGNTIWVKNKINIIREENGTVNKIFGIVSDISLNKKAEADMHNFTENLRELNDTKDRFISIISHDLRTPFSSIMGFTDLLLKDENLGNEKQRQYISFIKESSANMLALVNSLLDWTRLQTGRIKFEPERMNSKVVIMKSIQMLAGSAIQKEIDLVSKVETDLYVHADESLMLQVFNNLIGNAIKFTKPGGHISVNAEPVVEKKYVRFSVKDDGVGIKEADKEKLFRVDTKFTSNGTGGEKGSGLGLSLVKDIVNKHGGDIWVESKKGEGTEFFFSIPISSTRILLVDDLNTDRLLYSKLLRSFLPDYTIDEAVNGKDAFEQIEKSTPALVISDHKMPVMTGYDLVKQISVSDLKFKPPVIILSADIIETIEQEYKDLGVEFIFRKPVNLASFKAALDASLKKAIINFYA